MKPSIHNKLESLADRLEEINALLAEPDSLYLVAFLGHDDVAFGFVARCPLGFVIARDTDTSETGVFRHLTSSSWQTYGRPQL